MLREEFAKAIKGKGWTRTRQGMILKIILYGSMARGKPVRDLSTGYRSDFDLLVVVNHPDLADDDWWYGAKDGLDLDASSGAVRYPYNLVVHDLADVNDQLHRRRPFFVDVNRDGIVIYEFEPKELAKPRNLSAAEKLEEAREHFEQWHPNIIAFLAAARFLQQRGDLMDHSRGGVFHSFSDRLKIRWSSLVAASSLGKWPLANGWECLASVGRGMCGNEPR